MKQLVIGILIGSALTSAMVEAKGKLYGNDGSVQAPRGSVQQQDYFRQRQQWLDIAAMRRQAEQDRLSHMTKPCGK